MIAFSFTFPGGRYHATPWGRHVSEADVAWPPEPVRILRALIATWWRKADQAAFPKPVLDDLVDGLADEAPIFQLPEAVHAHTRAFMPTPKGKRLIFDAFLRVEPDAPLIVAWPSVSLQEPEETLARHLLARLGYLGRAESWARAEIATQWDGSFNAAPRRSGAPTSELTALDIMVPRTAADWREERARHLNLGAGLRGAVAARVRSTLPERLCDAIAIDTGQWQVAGWSTPPVLRRLVYDRPEIGPLPTTRRAMGEKRDPLATPGVPEVARLLLAGRPRPRIEDTLRIAEVLRLALMSKFSGGLVPRELSGRDANGPLRDDPTHAHAFYLPEDADGDGFIDHLIVYSPVGFSDLSRRALDGLTRLYITDKDAPRRATGAEGGAEVDDRGRKEWRVALDHLGGIDKAGGSRLFGSSLEWVSATPFMRTRHDDVRTYDFGTQVETYIRAFLREWRQRRPGEPDPLVEPIRQQGQDRFGVGPRERSPLHFARTRPRGRGGPQPDAMGASLRLCFQEPTAGPLAFGKHAHLGMGLFERPAL